MAGACELLGAGEPGRTRAHDGDPLAGLDAGGSGFTQPCSKARSTMAHSMVLMVTGCSSRLSVQEASQGAGQTRPVNSGKLLVECRFCALPASPRDRRVVPVRDLIVHRTAGVTIGTPQSMQRAACVRFSASEAAGTNSRQCLMRSRRLVVAVVALELEESP